MKKYTQTELRNKSMPLLRRLQRQIENTNQMKNDNMSKSIEMNKKGMNVLHDLKMKEKESFIPELSSITKKKEVRTRINLYDRRNLLNRW